MPIMPPAKNTFPLAALVLFVGLFIPHMLFADNNITEQTVEPVNTTLVMPEVLVEADKITPTTGTVILDKETIETLPIRNGNVNEIIGIVPGVQYSEDSADSFTQGEIQPSPVSISGSRFYDNNYTIDGISNNSPLDPASDTQQKDNKLPGHPQIHFLNSEIIDQITVYNSNIPAEYGGFTGGQVNVTTIEPDDEFWAKLTYRTTRDRWTKFHLDPKKQDEFHNPEATSSQPKFIKHSTGFTMNLPLSEDTGVLASHQLLYSKIPTRQFGESNNQVRAQENFLLKLMHHLPNDGKITLTALSSPTRSDYFYESFKQSNSSIDSQNKSLIVEYENEADRGQFLLNIGYTDHRIIRNSDLNRYRWNPEGASIDWETGQEGGRGDLQTSHKELNIRSSFLFHDFSYKQTSHQLKIGVEASHSRQNYKRPNTGYYYYSSVLDNTIICAPGDPACIDNEQYLMRRVVYNKTEQTAEVFEISAYVQDVITWKRLEFFPGLRISYDDITEEKNVAPRFSTAVDIFGNKSTILFAGLNRYYSGTLLTHSLYKAIETSYQSRMTSGNTPSDWSGVTGTIYQDGSVKTPYSDEKTVGIIQKVLGGELKLQYITKTSKNELARTRIDNPPPTPDVYVLNNLGRSEHESYQVSWQRAWKRAHIEINATWQETTSSHADYDSTFDEEDQLKTVWYGGDELYAHDIPRLDFNRPFIGNLIFSCQLPYDITFTNVTKYRGAYWRLWNTLERKPSIVSPDQPKDSFVYEKRKSKPTFIFDWHLGWKIPSPFKYHVVLTLDVLNVFNKRSKIAYQTGLSGYDYEVGRQFWAGVEFNF